MKQTKQSFLGEISVSNFFVNLEIALLQERL